MADPKRYLYGLDAVRFASALLVVIFHLGFWSWAASDSTPAQYLKGAATFDEIVGTTWFGWVGVEIFFVISGFVIANSAQGATAAHFFKQRVLRLYPAVWICATLTFLTILLGGVSQFEDVLPRYLHTILLFPNGTWIGWIDGPYWTLAIEISFYFLVLLTLLFPAVLTLHRLAWYMTAMSLAYIALLGLSYAGCPTSLLDALHKHQYVSITFLQMRYGCLFAVGIWLWTMTQGRMTLARYAALCIALCTSAWETYLRATDFIGWAPVIGQRTQLYAVFVMLTAIVLIAAVSLFGNRLVPTAEPCRNALRRLGLMTYPLYLLHDIVGSSVMHAFLILGTNRWIALLASISFVVAGSWLISFYLEPRLRTALFFCIEWISPRRRQSQA